MLQRGAAARARLKQRGLSAGVPRRAPAGAVRAVAPRCQARAAPQRRPRLRRERAQRPLPSLSENSGQVVVK